jgi:hypothetical protein
MSTGWIELTDAMLGTTVTINTSYILSITPLTTDKGEEHTSVSIAGYVESVVVRETYGNVQHALHEGVLIPRRPAFRS